MSNNNIRPMTDEAIQRFRNLMQGVEIKQYIPAEKPKSKISYGKKGKRKSIEVKR